MRGSGGAELFVVRRSLILFVAGTSPLNQSDDKRDRVSGGTMYNGGISPIVANYRR